MSGYGGRGGEGLSGSVSRSRCVAVAFITCLCNVPIKPEVPWKVVWDLMQVPDRLCGPFREYLLGELKYDSTARSGS
ncbi:hypothetical protein CCUS01_03056 [Colletotrichum cuscutae]|uniref:Uncharacterized protein n=1 Tax=Colletotrichum cuscutae TaxID=1209917 RepID=A0AAJ0DMW4_9PEZI|nr:hypothetical protein CCUS01_03056 [Colletotrichum cuscutae]